MPELGADCNEQGGGQFAGVDCAARKDAGRTAEKRGSAGAFGSCGRTSELGADCNERGSGQFARADRVAWKDVGRAAGERGSAGAFAPRGRMSELVAMSGAAVSLRERPAEGMQGGGHLARLGRATRKNVGSAVEERGSAGASGSCGRMPGLGADCNEQGGGQFARASSRGNVGRAAGE